MFEREAEEYCMHQSLLEDVRNNICEAFEDGAEFGYNQGKAEANEWHRVSDKLPALDVFVYLWKEGKDFPVVARRHLPYGQKEWVWDCMWGSGYTMSQLKGKDYLWKEMVLPKEIK